MRGITQRQRHGRSRDLNKRREMSAGCGEGGEGTSTSSGGMNDSTRRMLLIFEERATPDSTPGIGVPSPLTVAPLTEWCSEAWAPEPCDCEWPWCAPLPCGAPAGVAGGPCSDCAPRSPLLLCDCSGPSVLPSNTAEPSSELRGTFELPEVVVRGPAAGGFPAAPLSAAFVAAGGDRSWAPFPADPVRRLVEGMSEEKRPRREPPSFGDSGSLAEPFLKLPAGAGGGGWAPAALAGAPSARAGRLLAVLGLSPGPEATARRNHGKVQGTGKRGEREPGQRPVGQLRRG